MDGPPRPGLGAIARVFARFANTTFGGGSATIATLRGQLVGRHGWLDDAACELAYALSRLTPGTNLLAFCAGAGWLMRRWLGAAVALVAASLPCALLAVAMVIGYDELIASPLFRAAMAGALAAAVAIVVATAWVFAEPHLRAAPWKAVVIAAVVVALAVGARFSPLRILIVAAVIGLAWPARDEPAPPAPAPPPPPAPSPTTHEPAR